MQTKLILAAFAALALGAGAAHAGPKTGITTLERGTAQDQTILVESSVRWDYYGPGPNYYMQQYPGPNCYAHPHPYYGWICY